MASAGQQIDREDEQTSGFSEATSALTNESCFGNEQVVNGQAAVQIHGRKEETNHLLQAYQRVFKTGVGEVVFVHGQAGSGKTSLIETAMRESVTSSGGYYVTGKFDQIQMRDPYSAIIAAFNDLCDIVIQSARVKEVKQALEEALGDELQVFARLVSGVIQITGVATDDTLYYQQFSLGHAFIRFKQQCRSFLRCCASSKKNPVVLFLDDLQFANDDEESLELIQSLMESDIASILIIGTYRDDQEGPHEAIIENLKALPSSTVRVTDIELNNLDTCQVNGIVSGLLTLDPSETASLAVICYKKTSGNPYFVIQYMILLRSLRLLNYSTDTMRWEWDDSMVQSGTNVTSNILDVLTKRAQSTSSEVCSLLQLAACFGFEFDLEMLLHVAEAEIERRDKQERSALSCDKVELLKGVISVAEKEGFIEQVDGSLYKWTHDRVMQCFESLVPLPGKAQLHVRIAEVVLLIDKEPPPSKLRFIVDQFNVGAASISDTETLIELAQRNLQVGDIALSKSGYASGQHYFEKGIEMLPGGSWVSCYGLTLSLYTKAAEAAHCTGDHVTIEMMVKEILKYGTSAEDCFVANRIQVSMIGAQGQFDKSLVEARCVLKGLGVKLPRRATILHVMYELLTTQRAVKGKTDSDILTLPALDEKRVMAMEILSIIARDSFFESPELQAVVSLRMMRISLKYGLCQYSPQSLAMFGMIQVAMKKYDVGFRFGQLSIRLMDEFQFHAAKARAVCYFYSFYHLKNPMFETIEKFDQSYHSGLKVGDVEFGLVCGLHAGQSMLVSAARPLDEASEYTRQIYDQMVEFNDSTNVFMLCPIFQTILNLSGEADDPARLSGEIMVEDELLRRLPKDKNEMFVLIVWIYCHHLACYFGEWQLADVYLSRVLGLKSALETVDFHYLKTAVRLFGGLTHLAMYRETGARKHMVKYRRSKTLLNAFVKRGVITFIPALRFLEAEEKSMTGSKMAVQAAFLDAIGALAEARYINHEALCCEHAGNAMMHRFSDKEAAGVFYNKAKQKYSAWRAWAKVDDVQRKLDALAEKKLQGLPNCVILSE